MGGGVVSEPEQGRSLFGEVMVPGSGVAGAHGAQAEFARPGLTTKHRDAAAWAWGCGDSLPGHSVGKDYFGARWYDSSTARWLSEEPLRLDGPNMYNYLGGDAQNFIDVTGFYRVINGSGVTPQNRSHATANSVATALMNSNCARAMMDDLGLTQSDLADILTPNGKGPTITFAPPNSTVYGGGGTHGQSTLTGEITIYTNHGYDQAGTLAYELGNYMHLKRKQNPRVHPIKYFTMPGKQNMASNASSRRKDRNDIGAAMEEFYLHPKSSIPCPTP